MQVAPVRRLALLLAFLAAMFCSAARAQVDRLPTGELVDAAVRRVAYEAADAGLWINGGFFVLSSQIFDHLEPGEELVYEPFQRLIKLDPDIAVNTLNNYFFTTASSLLIIGLGWWITDKVVEPRVQGTPIDGDEEDLPVMHDITPAERRGGSAVDGDVPDPSPLTASRDCLQPS